MPTERPRGQRSENAAGSKRSPQSSQDGSDAKRVKLEDDQYINSDDNCSNESENISWVEDVRQRLPPVTRADSHGAIPPARELTELQNGLQYLSRRAKRELQQIQSFLHEHREDGVVVGKSVLSQKRSKPAITKYQAQLESEMIGTTTTGTAAAIEVSVENGTTDRAVDNKQRSTDSGEQQSEQQQSVPSSGKSAADSDLSVGDSPSRMQSTLTQLRDQIFSSSENDSNSSSSSGVAETDEARRRRTCVACEPTDDLVEMLPGDPVDEDFSKVKPTNQIPFATFQNHLEPYMRRFSEDDLKFLRTRGDMVTPFTIPPLGTHYTDIWNDDKLVDDDASSTAASSLLDAATPKGATDNLTDEILATEDVSCGPFTERLLSSLVRVERGSAVDSSCAEVTALPQTKFTALKGGFAEIEERVKQELQHVGLLSDEDVDWAASEQDEICATLRSLQKQLREQCLQNMARKKRLAEATCERLAYEEFMHILDDLDKQIDQTFLRKQRSNKNKRKRLNSSVVGSVHTKSGLDPVTKNLIEKRSRWIHKVGAIFGKDPFLFTRIPKESLYKNLDAEIKQLQSSESFFFDEAQE